jgi:hypothetical protein
MPRILQERLQPGIKLITFRISVMNYSTGCTVTVQRFVNAISFINDGTTTVNVMGEPIAPGQSKSIGGNLYEVFDEKNLTVQFVGAGVNSLWVTQKYYVDLLEFGGLT